MLLSAARELPKRQVQVDLRTCGSALRCARSQTRGVQAIEDDPLNGRLESLRSRKCTSIRLEVDARNDA